MKKKFIFVFILHIIALDIFADRVELKSGRIYEDVITTVEPDYISIKSKNGKTVEVSKKELTRLIPKDISWNEGETAEQKVENKNSYSIENTVNGKENNPSSQNKKDAEKINSNDGKSGKDKDNSKITNSKNPDKSENSNLGNKDRNKGFYVQTSLVNWQVGGMENFVGMQNSRLLNSAFFRNTAANWLSAPIIRLSNDKITVSGKAIDFGYKFGNNTNYPGKFQFRHVRSDSVNFNSLNIWEYSDPGLVIVTGEIEMYKFSSNRRNIISYEQKYFFNPKSENRFHSRFGILGGINAQFDSLKGSLTPIGSGSGVDSSGVASIKTTLPLTAKTNYSETSYFLNLGFIYTLNTVKNQELEIIGNIYKGISSGDASYNLISVYSIPNGTTKTFSSNLNGFGFNLGYIFTLTEVWNLKLSYESRFLTYNIEKVKTSNFSIALGQDYGPFSSYSDRLAVLGISMEYKF